MKRLAAPLLLLVLLLGHVHAAAAAQASPSGVLRVLILPFDATSTFEPYGLGLATALQRTLNSLDGIYAPPVAEGGLYVSRAHRLGVEAVDAATTAFAADAVISGAVSGSGNTLQVTLAFAGPHFSEPINVNLQLASDPAAAAEGVAAEVAARLGHGSGEERNRIARLSAQAPQLVSLDSVARAASRLNVGLADLAAAAQLDGDSSWVLAEYARALALAGRNDEALQQAAAAVETAPEDAEAQVVLGIVAQAAGDFERARGAYRAALELNSQHALALAGLAQLAESPAEARDLYGRALTAAPRLEEAALGLASLQASDQQTLQTLRRASRNLPESVALHRAFIDTAMAAGDAAGALSYLQSVAADPLARSAALYGLAGLLPESMAQQALEFVRAGREHYPESSGLQLTEAELLVQLGNTAEAQALLESLRESYPESVEVANSLAVLLARQGDIERAREVFASVADDSATVQVNLARLLVSSGQARAALSVLEPLVAQSGNDAEVQTLYGLALGRTGRTDEAVAALGRALELDPEAGEARQALALFEQQRDITGETTVALEGEAASLFEQGLQQLETGQTAEAAQSFGRAHELSGNGLTAFYQGYALQLSGRVRESLAPYTAAAEAFPESDTVLNNLGYAQLQLGRFDLALDTLRRAEGVSDDNSSVHVNLGLTYYGLGRYSAALEQWERALQLDPSLEGELAQVREAARERSGQQ